MVKRIFLLFCLVSILIQSGLAQSKQGFIPKSEKTALGYSLFGTLVPVVAGGIIFFGFSDQFENWDDGESIIAASIGGFGIIFGPAFGHCYAGENYFLLKGFLVRGLPLGLIPLGTAFSESMQGSAHVGPGVALPIGIAVVSAIYDTATVEKSVDKHNTENGFSKIELKPTYFAQENAPGLMLSINF